MIRRIVMTCLATALAAPLYVSTPASGAILFSCPSISSGSHLSLTPGWSHTQTAQTVGNSSVFVDSACSNGEAEWYVAFGQGWSGLHPTVTYPPRPLGCPFAWGGAGPDNANQTPILLGATDPSFGIFWPSTGDLSWGIAKAKAGSSGSEYRLVFTITSGKYAAPTDVPPPGERTKVKLTVALSPTPEVSYTCADDSDPLEDARLALVGSLIVNQK
jgi:hypothetical protein